MVDQDTVDVFLSLVQDIADELDLHNLCHKILVNVERLTDADRGSLFLVESFEEGGDAGATQVLVPKLFDVTVDSGKLPRFGFDTITSIDPPLPPTPPLPPPPTPLLSPDMNEALSKAADEAVPIQFGFGIAGHVAQTKTSLRIDDVYAVIFSSFHYYRW